MNLSGKVILVTGASRGIGRAIATELASKGATIAINYSKEDEGANRYRGKGTGGNDNRKRQKGN